MIVNFALTLTEWQCIQLSQLIVRLPRRQASRRLVFYMCEVFGALDAKACAFMDTQR